jgi:triosephosphate isomerase
MPRKIAAGNWKMNGLSADLDEVQELVRAHPSPQCDVIICPPATLVGALAWASEQSALMVGAQDCHANFSGAHTGDISAAMLAEAGASHIITGHSERRTDHGETNEMIAAKTAAIWAAGLTAIICVGETAAERDAGQTLDVVRDQIAGSVPDSANPRNTILAYEPIWAIGTGRTATPAEIAEVHAAIRATLIDRLGPNSAEMSLLYGGSVKAGNAAEIFAVADVDGALVGGASLKSADFGPIVAALSAA